jgi:hypothetical protein
MCVIGGSAFLILSETINSVCKFELIVLQTKLRYQIDLKLLFGITSANLSCLGDRVAIVGRANTMLKFILIDPKADLTVQNRIRAMVDIDGTGVTDFLISTSTSRVILTVTRQSSPKFELYSINKNGIRRFYLKGSAEQLGARSFIDVRVNSKFSTETFSFLFNLNLSRKVYTKGATSDNITYIGTQGLNRLELGEARAEDLVREVEE